MKLKFGENEELKIMCQFCLSDFQHLKNSK